MSPRCRFPAERGKWIRQRVAHYGTRRGPSKDIGQDLRQRFLDVRKEMLESRADIPVADSILRLRYIQELVDRVVASDRMKQGEKLDRLVTLLEQARKETDKAGSSITITNTAIGSLAFNLDPAR